MTIDKVRQAHRAVPFRPFTLHLADGRSFHVPHPEFLSLSPAGQRTVIVYGQGDEMDILDILLVTDIEIHSSAAPRRRGGLSRR